MNYFDLATTTPDVLEKIRAAESAGTFSVHLDPIDYSNCYPVDENFPYVPTGKLLAKYRLKNFFFLRPFTWWLNRFVFHTKVVGKSNLHGIKNAVLTCNHVNKLDALVVKHAVAPHRFKVMVGDFNNQKGQLGDIMRAAGILPFSTNIGAVKSFHAAMAHYLKSSTYVLFFPEGSEWWCYEKPRPFFDGAFHYAVKNDVPVIPTFITFKRSGKYDKNGIEQRYFTLHILPPIYRDPALSKRENTERMRQMDEQACLETYQRSISGKK